MIVGNNGLQTSNSTVMAFEPSRMGHFMTIDGCRNSQNRGCGVYNEIRNKSSVEYSLVINQRSCLR